MDFYINLKVNFRGNSKNFLLSGSETKSWESVEATVGVTEAAASSASLTHKHMHTAMVFVIFNGSSPPDYSHGYRL